MKKKINRTKRIIINPKKKTQSYGFIFMYNKKSTKSTKFNIKTNISYIYYKLDTENEFDIFGKPHKNSKIEPSKILNNKYNLEDKDIVDIINIYNRVLKLYIVVLKYNTKIPNFITKQYIDLYYLSNDNIDNIDNIPSVYNNIYNYSKHNYSNTYLDYIIINREYDVYIKIIDIYFYLIGYI